MRYSTDFSENLNELFFVDIDFAYLKNSTKVNEFIQSHPNLDIAHFHSGLMRCTEPPLDRELQLPENEWNVKLFNNDGGYIALNFVLERKTLTFDAINTIKFN